MNMKAHGLRGLLIVLFIVLAIGTPWRSVAQQPIRIGASMSITGRYATQSAYQREGYLLCQKHVNEKGGVLGRTIEFLIQDDRSDEQNAVRLYEKLITEDKVDAVMGPYSSPITDAVAEVTEKHRKLMVAPTAGSTAIWEKGRRYLVMVLSPLEVVLEGTVDLAARNGLKTIALINEDALGPKTVVKGGLALANKKGLDVVVHEAYPKGTTDFSAILSKVKAAKPDVLVVAAFPDETVAITRQAQQMDVNVKMFSGTTAGSLPDYYKRLGKTAEFV